MTKRQLENRIETLQWEIECTVSDRAELYRALDEAVFELMELENEAA